MCIRDRACFFTITTLLTAQDSRYGLAFANEAVNGNTLCLDIQMQFTEGGKLGSSNLVMKYNRTMLGNPVYAASSLPSAQYHTTTVTNPLDSLASFNIELLAENNGMTIATAPLMTTVGQLCFDVLAGMDASYLDWRIQTTAATVVYLDDESTALTKGTIAPFCNNTGQACDDGDANTTGDVYDINCLCAGMQLACINNDQIDLAAIPARTYKSRMRISSTGLIRPNASVTFKAGDQIDLAPGFYAEPGSAFLAMIEACADNAIVENATSRTQLENFSTNNFSDIALAVHPNPVANNATITYVVPKTDKLHINLYTLDGQLLQTLFKGTKEEGMHLIDWQVAGLPKGMYFMSLETRESRVVRKVVFQ